jgi:hypothetical protein
MQTPLFNYRWMSDNQFVKTSLCSVMTLVSAWAVSSSAVAYQPAGKFKTEEQARKYCPNDQVVRVDLTTRRFYAKGHFLYGVVSGATFECLREALQEGNLPG